jgi:multiple sugar transport system permease protein/cellobiose transport system permease protein
MNRKITIFLIYLVLIVVTVIAVSPFYFMIIMGTYRTQDLGRAGSLIPGNYFLANLKSVLQSGFLLYYWNSMYIAVIFTVLSVLLSATAGYGFAKFNFRLNKPLHTFVVGAMMIPAQLGLIGYVIEMRGLHLGGTFWSVFLGDVATCFGVFWMTQYISGALPNEVLESARIDGCGEWKIFFRIALPYSSPAMATLAIIQFVFSWNNYLRPLVTLTDPYQYTIPLGIAALASRYMTDYAAQVTALSLGTIPLIIVFLCGSRTFILGLTSGAVKG